MLEFYLYFTKTIRTFFFFSSVTKTSGLFFGPSGESGLFANHTTLAHELQNYAWVKFIMVGRLYYFRKVVISEACETTLDQIKNKKKYNNFLLFEKQIIYIRVDWFNKIFNDPTNYDTLKITTINNLYSTKTYRYSSNDFALVPI